MDAFSLVADMNYVGDNAPRLSRALFEIALRNQWTAIVTTMLTVHPPLEPSCSVIFMFMLLADCFSRTCKLLHVL